MPNTSIFTCTTGGWIRAEYWWTRSTFDDEFSTRTTGAYIYVTPNATISPSWSRITIGLSNYNDQTVTAL